MPYTTSIPLIKKAQADGYAVPAFNAENLEMVQAIIEAAEQEHSPVLIQTTPPTAKYLSLPQAAAMVMTQAEKSTVSVALHLDHCTDFDYLMQAIHAGYTSVMFDGSKLSFEENAAMTKKVMDTAKPMGISVEAELGTIGGKEDNVSAEVIYTEVGDAVRFVAETGVDMLAIAIGTAHGFYKGQPKLNFDRLEEINKATCVPLVMHGGSGLPDEHIQKAIRLGICKVNFATELRAAATNAVRIALQDESMIDPKKFMQPAKEAVKALCIEKIRVCGSNNKI